MRRGNSRVCRRARLTPGRVAQRRVYFQLYISIAERQTRKVAGLRRGRAGGKRPDKQNTGPKWPDSAATLGPMGILQRMPTFRPRQPVPLVPLRGAAVPAPSAKASSRSVGFAGRNPQALSPHGVPGPALRGLEGASRDVSLSWSGLALRGLEGASRGASLTCPDLPFVVWKAPHVMRADIGSL